MSKRAQRIVAGFLVGCFVAWLGCKIYITLFKSGKWDDLFPSNIFRCLFGPKKDILGGIFYLSLWIMPPLLGIIGGAYEDDWYEGWKVFVVPFLALIVNALLFVILMLIGMITSGSFLVALLAIIVLIGVFGGSSYIVVIFIE